MTAIYRNRKYGKGNLFKKKRYKNSSKKFIKKRIKIKLQIVTFDVCLSPGLTEAFPVSSERLKMKQKEVEQIGPIQSLDSQTNLYFNGIVGNGIDVKIQL